jgi:hypothetical protein
MEAKYVYKRFSFTVTGANASYPKKFDLDKNVSVVSALLLSSDQPNMLFYRGSQKIEINSDELYPEDYESKLLMSGISVPPDERYVELGNGVLSGNGEVKLLYKDKDNPATVFAPYDVVLNLKCELK